MGFEFKTPRLTHTTSQTHEPLRHVNQNPTLIYTRMCIDNCVSIMYTFFLHGDLGGTYVDQQYKQIYSREYVHVVMFPLSVSVKVTDCQNS